MFRVCVCVCVVTPKRFQIQVYLGLLEAGQCEVIRAMYLSSTEVLTRLKLAGPVPQKSDIFYFYTWNYCEDNSVHTDADRAKAFRFNYHK
jgi:hypothetical protein